MFPTHKTYVEPFFGGGAVFFEKEPSEKEVVNDLDPVLMRDYRRLLTAPTDISAYPIPRSESAQNAFLRTANKGKAAQIVESLLRRCNGFGGKYLKKGDPIAKVYTDERTVSKVTTHESKLKNIADYKARLKSATLTSEGYDAVLRKYDGADTFFFMDPPYEMSKGIGYAAGSESFDFEALAGALRALKGKFLVTINDSPYIRKTFKGFNQYKYVVVGHHSEVSGIGSKDRKELLVTNYVLPRMWKSKLTGGATHRENVLKKLQPTGLSLPELAEASGESVDVLQQVYNRGIGAYKTNPESVRKKDTFEKGPAPMSEKLSKEQWAKARVYSFLDGNPKHDTDLRQQSLLAGRGGGAKPFTAQLKEGKYSPGIYLRAVKSKAKKAGYDPEAVKFAEDGTHKLEIQTPDGRTVKFGRVGYGDFLIWTHKERRGEAPEGIAKMKRKVFHLSHSAIKGDWKDDKFSPNNLALALLW